MTESRVGEIFSAIIYGDGSGRSLPQQLCEACAQALPVSGVGMALMTSSGHQGVVGATDGVARRLEDLQFSVGEGPCMDASRAGRPVLQPDFARTGVERWPGLAPELLSAGVAAVFAFPLQYGGIRLGVLDLYRDTIGVLDDEQLREALAYADAAATVLLHLQDQMVPGQGLHPQLAEPSARPEINLATGMITVQAGIGLTEALLMLRAHAYSAERPLLEVAREVVARTLRFGPETESS